jgi:hypothetical protein
MGDMTKDVVYLNMCYNKGLLYPKNKKAIILVGWMGWKENVASYIGLKMEI